MRKIFLFFCCMTSTALADCNVDDVLPTLRPGSHFNVRGNTYNGIEWLDVVSSPSFSEVQIAQIACQQNSSNLKNRFQNDIFNIKLSTNPIQQKFDSLIDLMQSRGQLQ